MNNFEKTKVIYEHLGWKYYGWNDPDRKLNKAHKKGYFAPKEAKFHNIKTNVHFNEGNLVGWGTIMWFANELKYMLVRTPYTTEKSLDEIYNFVLRSENG